MDEIEGKELRGWNITKAFGENEYDDVDILELVFADGSFARFQATYGSYTGNSKDEYPCFIKRIN